MTPQEAYDLKKGDRVKFVWNGNTAAGIVDVKWEYRVKVKWDDGGEDVFNTLKDVRNLHHA